LPFSYNIYLEAIICFDNRKERRSQSDSILSLIPQHSSYSIYICWYQNAQITNTGKGQRNTCTGTSSGTGSPILDTSLVSSCLT